MATMAKKCLLVLGLATGLFATPAMGIDVRKCYLLANVSWCSFVSFIQIIVGERESVRA
jgi:hypothetical protein